MKTILITGGSGFIGRWTIAPLIKLGYDVHVIVFSDTDKEVCNQWENITTHECDLLDHSQHPKLMCAVRPSHLLHFAWDVRHEVFWQSELNLSWLSASLSLIQAFNNIDGKRVVISGSCAEYDWDFGCCVEETTPLNANTLYGVCKANLFSTLRSYCKNNEIDFAWGRIFHLYGPHENKNKFVSDIATNMLRNKTVNCSHGKQMRDYMYVKDVASAFVALLESKYNGPVNIASGRPLQLMDIVKTIAKTIGFKGRINFGKIQPSKNDPPILIANTERLNKKIKFKTKYSLEQGLEETINFLKDNI